MFVRAILEGVAFVAFLCAISVPGVLAQEYFIHKNDQKKRKEVSNNETLEQTFD